MPLKHKKSLKPILTQPDPTSRSLRAPPSLNRNRETQLVDVPEASSSRLQSKAKRQLATTNRRHAHGRDTKYLAFSTIAWSAEHDGTIQQADVCSDGKLARERPALDANTLQRVKEKSSSTDPQKYQQEGNTQGQRKVYRGKRAAKAMKAEGKSVEWTSNMYDVLENITEM
ncbi:hypothetical protein EV356DRAFT_506531 [Viridothelium virens]|uniref:Uncharacterized protein n=1 Tax=Viridothelium virens TaxID=1048519 RepID=A0A6A6H1F2_VIRVR|nr:hypothetical protein EV356DRAFT_506531 [Viridothelium virens]